MMKLLISKTVLSFLSLLALSSQLSAQQQVQIQGPDYICYGDCGTFSLAGLTGGSTAGTEVFWYDGNNPDLILSNGPTVTICPNAPGPFRLFVLGVTANGQEFGDSTVVFVEDLPLDVRISSDAAELCPAANEMQPGSVQGCETVCAGATVTYSWVVLSNDVFSSNVQVWVVGAESYDFQPQLRRVVVNWGTAGLGSINFQAFGQPCGFFNETICVRILDDPQASFTAVPAPVNDTITICRGQEVLFQNTSEFASSYLWSLGNGQVSDQTNPSAIYTEPGVYQVELTAFNDCLCSDRTSLTIVVEGGESPLVDCVSTICEQTVGTYTAQADCGSYAWSVSSNGTIIEGGGLADDYVTVEWAHGPEGIIELAVADCADLSTCLAPSFIRIPIIGDSTAIDGPSRVCRGEQVQYSIPAYEGTAVSWSVSALGTIIAGQGTREITVEWFGNSLPSPFQWVRVEYDHCYLGCGGADTLQVRIHPEFYLSGPIEVCTGSSAAYQARRLPGNNLVPSHWRVENAAGDEVWASPAPTSAPTIAWDFPPGLYRLVARAENNAFYCHDERSMAVSVLALPAAADSIIGPAFVCPGELYAFEAAPNLPNIRYEWTIEDGGNTTTQYGRITTTAFGPAPPYALSVTLTSPQGCTSLPATLALETLPPPSIQGPAEACNESTTVFSTAHFVGQVYQWEISPAGAGVIIGEKDQSTIEVRWRRPGPATVSVQRCGQAANQAIQIHALPQPVAQSQPVCAGQLSPVQATAAFSAYEWRDAAGSLRSTVAAPLLPAGAYQLLVTDQNGCRGDTVFQIADLAVPQVSISTPDPRIYCNAAPFARLFALDAEAGYAYQWYRDGNPVGGNNPIYTATAFGAYFVEATAPNGCAAISNTILLYEDCAGGPPADGCDVPGVSIDILPTGNCSDRAYQLAPANYIPGSIAWGFDDPASGPNNWSPLPNPSHQYTRPGFYQVVVLADFPSVGNPADTVTCAALRIDTVFLTADFRFDTVCAGEPLAFTDLSTFLPISGIASWEWDFGDLASGADNYSTLPNPTHVYSAPGDYIVRLEINSTEGCLASAIKTVTIQGPPPVDFDHPPINCENTSLPFVANAGPEVVSVYWEFGDPAERSELFESYHEFAAPGSYTVTLNATSVYGCAGSFSRAIEIEPNTLSGAIAAAPASTICAGDSVLLTAPSGGIAWEWSNGENTTAISVAETGLYSLTLTDDKGCTYRPSPQAVEVLPAPSTLIRAVEFNDFMQPRAYFYDSYQVCDGASVFLEAIANPAYSYAWSTGQTGTTVEFSDARENLLPVGTHEIFVTVTDNSTSCAHVEGPFTVVIAPLPPAVQIAADPTGQNCSGTPVTFSALAPSPELDYRWSNGFSGPTMTTSVGGHYSLTATNMYGCSAESPSLEILAGPNIALVPNGCYSACSPDTICLPEVPGVVSYQWFFEGSPLAPPSNTVPELVADQSGAYYLEMTDGQGCTLASNPLRLELSDGFGTIQGQVFFDVNENGIIDAADTLYSGALLQLRQGGLLTGSAASDAAGAYAFSNIAAADYVIELDTAALPPGFSALTARVDTTLSGCGTLIAIDWLLQFICPTDTTLLHLQGCSNNLPVFDGQPFTRDTSFTLVYSSFIGCDSTVHVTIQVSDADTASLQLQACAGQTIEYAGETLGPGEQREFVFQNAVGCDSVVTVTVSALPVSVGQEQLVACLGTTVEYEGVALSPGEQREFVFQNAVGCDSLVTVTVSALPVSVGQEQLEACPGTTVEYEGVALSPGEQREFVFQNAVGCDSVVTVTVSALPVSVGQEQLVACLGTTVEYEGEALSPGEQREFVFQNAVGCDSVVTVTVSALPVSVGQEQLETCLGTTVEYEGVALSPGEQREFVFQNAVGCDSVVTVTVSALPVSVGQEQLVACLGTTVEYEGEALSPGEQREFVFQNAVGCDSVVTVTVSALPVSVGQEQLEACPGTTVEYEGEALSPGEQREFVFQNAVGCDSVVTVTVSALPVSVGQEQLEACPGTTVEYEGETLSPGEQREFVFQNAVGCDSVVTVSVQALPPLEVSIASYPIDCENPLGELVATVLSGDDGALSLSWSNGASGPHLQTALPGSYTLLAQNGCEEVRREALLESFLPDPSALFYIPNAFSPNGDGVNDEFRSYSPAGLALTRYELMVFDRWGNMLFRTEDPTAGWDGFHRGRRMNPGMFVWQVRAVALLCEREVEVEEKGGVYLVR
jgi:gliding motility-associated-like protein